METRCYGCMKLKNDSPICEHCGYDEGAGNAVHQLPAGTLLKEQYRMGKVLGQGGFGITYLGWDEYLDIPLAIKEYFPSGVVMRENSVTLDVISCGGDEDSRFLDNKRRFLREAKSLAKFSQVPEIVQVRNFFTANNTAYIVMEYVDGITLKKYVKDKGGKLSPEETFAILAPIIQALGKVHDTELIHRDISPDNIMLLPGGGVKLIDFGAVRDVGAANLTKSTESILKQGYAPIEQYQKRGTLGPWTDVYALCATMYYCITGDVPPDSPARLLGDEELDLEKLSCLTEQQKTALEHGLALRVEDRIKSTGELYRELLGAPEPQPEPPEPKPEEPKKETKPQPPHKESKPQSEKPEKPKKKSNFGSFLLAILVVGGIVLAALACTTDLTLLPIGSRWGSCGDDTKWTLDMRSGELVIDGSGRMHDFPASWETEGEEGLAPWYHYRDVIQSVRITGQVSNIGSYAFQDCGALAEVELSHFVQEIGDGAFRSTGVVEMDLSTGIYTLGKNVFQECPNLERLYIGPMTSLNYDTWAGPMVTDEHGNIPENFTLEGSSNNQLQNYAEIFGYQYAAKSSTTWHAEGNCGANLKWHFDQQTGFLLIEGTGPMWDFNGTWQNEDRDLGYASNRNLPPWTDFRDEIRTVSIADGVGSIGENAFERCSYLRDVHFGGDLKAIGANAFHSCDIDEIVLPDNITTIEPGAFTWCLELKYVQLPLELKTLQENTFSNCQNIEELFIGPDTVLEDSGDTPFGSITSAGIPGNITLYSLSGSDTERFCNDYLFPEFGQGYQGMYIDATGQCGDEIYWFKSGDQLVLYGDGKSWLYQITDEERRDWAERDWPNSWLHAGAPDFYEYRNEIRHIRILPGVDGLNHRLFTDFENLESIDFGTVQTTHMSVNNCGLEYAYIPENMVGVGEWMFGWCRNLRVVEIAGGSEWVGEGLFEGCTSLEEVWFEGKECIGADTDLLNPNNDGEYSDKVVFYVKINSDGMRYVQRNGLEFRVHQ